MDIAVNSPRKQTVHYTINIPVWKQAPFLRLLAPLIAGILLQWHFPLPMVTIKLYMAVILLLLVLFPLIFKKQYLLLPQINGINIMLLVLFAGCWLVNRNDVRNNPQHIAQYIQPGMSMRAVISEPLTPKEKSYKTLARIISVYDGKHEVSATGTIFLYFRKDSLLPNVHDGLPAEAFVKAGDEIVFSKPLQEIRNNGNPGGMNYQRYCLFQGITHQVFLQPKDFLVTGRTTPFWLNRLLWRVRDFTLNIIRKHIPGTKEQGVAEALVIGYRNDMDRELTQAYSNTGAVHVIAISGMHLGLIYVMVMLLFKPFSGKKMTRWLKPVSAISILWLFTLVAGAAPSILRSAVMFTCIAIAESMGRRTNIYNTLAASAFILLCINPFSLWDVGFRLSYTAVLSIVIFMKPIYQLFTIKNKWLDYFWKLNAVTLSAQILTLPVVVFHFHQFPNLFLIANIVAVPLSGFILAAELALLVFSFFPFLAMLIGKVTGGMIFLLNYFIEWCSRFSFAVTDRLQMNGWECVCLFLIIIFAARWLFLRTSNFFIGTICFIFIFGLLRLYARTGQQLQRRIIVYHIPGQQAVDFVSGHHYFYRGNETVQSDPFLYNFHLKPSRVQFNITKDVPEQLSVHHPFYFFEQQCILLLDSSYRFVPNGQQRVTVNLLVLSHNPRIYLKQQAAVFNIKQVVADGSNPLWKIKLWKEDCDSLRIPFHQTGTQGAFVLNCR